MNTYSFAPIAQLRGVIKNVWIVDYNDSNNIEKMIPFGCMDLVYVESKQLSYYGKKMVQFNKNDIFLTGQVTQAYDLEYHANTQIIGFGFYPHTAHLFIQDAAFHFTDNIYHLSELFPCSDILDILGEKTKIADKIHILQQFILERLRRKKRNDQKQDYLHHLLKEMYERNGCFDVSKTQNELKISQRYIQSLFKEYVGMSPLLYSKVIRFLNAIDTYKKGKRSLTEIALDLGYYDQAHFIRDFKRFTGLSPKKYFSDMPYLIEQFTSNEQSSLLYNSFSEKLFKFGF